MASPTFIERAIQSGCNTLDRLADWPTRSDHLLREYEDGNPTSELSEVNLELAYFIFDLVAERVVLAYAFSTPSLTKRDASRIRGFPNVNASVKKAMGDRAFHADKGHFLGHASGGTLDINLFPQRRDLNRGWSDQGKRYRAMERYVANDREHFSIVAQSMMTTHGYHICLNTQCSLRIAVGGQIASTTSSNSKNRDG